jgi:tetratricopeptide (TPR) repeat protein
VARRQKLSYVDDPVKVGRRIRESRERLGISQRGLAFPGCTAAYISRIEKGERVPSLQILRVFAERLDVSEAFLARGEQQGATSLEDFAQGRAAVRLGEIETARAIANGILDAARDDQARARASALFGQIAFYEEDFQHAVDAVEQALLLDPNIETVEPDVAEVHGRAYARSGDYAAAFAVFIRSYEAAQGTGAPLEETRFGSLLANAYVDAGNFAEAEKVLGQVLAISDEVREPVARARILWTQSRLRALENDATAAARYATAAIEILEVSDHDYYAALGYQLLAHIELDRGNPARALELLDRGQALIEASGRPFEQASFRLEQIRALAKIGKSEEAASLAMAITPRFAEGRPIDSGRAYSMLADVFAELGDDDRAIELYELAIARFDGLQTRYAVEAYTRLAELFETKGRQKEALDLLKRAMRIQRSSGRLLPDQSR